MFAGKSASGRNKDTKTTNCGTEVDNKNDEDEEKCSTDSTRQQQTAAAGKDESSTRVSQNDQDDNDESISSSNGGTTMTTSARQSLAFTIDNFNDKECDAAVQAAKYKSMMERFQNRHRRGASMSKLENDESGGKAQTPTRLTSSQSSTPLTTNTRSSARSSMTSEENNANSLDSDASATQKVKLRVRDRSTSRVRDASKRHSWSPRSSTNENSLQTPASTANATATVTSTNNPTALPRKTTTKTANKPAPIQVPKGAANLVANRTQFTPRSTAMQLALKQIDYMCPQPPLADFKHLNADADDVSEAGTYTLDGDNYTEEQKDIMNIDKYGQSILPTTTIKCRPKELDAITPTPKQRQSIESKRSNNVLEVNYYHDSEGPEQTTKARTSTAPSDLIMGSHQSAGAYLEKIKSRVLRNMSATKQISDTKQEILKPKLSNDDDDSEHDTGCFTSVTTSGVLAKQRTLDAHPKLSRHSGLSTSQIDSSEYVSNETKLKTSGTPPSFASGYTDHQKAEYRLNVFTNQKDVSQKFAATRNLIETPPETPTGPQPSSKLSEVAVLQTAQTKHDWIQEWARNARARSLANDRHSTGARQSNNDMLMTRSYTCADTGNDSLTDDSLYSANCKQLNAKLNRTLADRYRLSGGNGDCDYASDPSLASSCTKPPKSPTKIPSPLHTLGRARSASRTRASLQNVMPPEEDDYLQQTAAAINNLQQSLSRKNSLKSPSHSASPRAHSARSHIMYSPEGTGVECSPQHSLNSQRQQRQATQNLMTSSINEQQLQLLTSGEYLLRQMRMRKNSFDGNLNGSPHRRVLQAGVPPQVQSPTTPTAPTNEESPLRRSSSFSARVAATQKAAGRPNFQNLYTPPAARHSYGLSPAPPQQTSIQPGNSIKKSASSNNFGQAYSDYDDNLQYYINDEDDQEDMGEEYYSSGGEENVEQEPEYYEDPEPENSVPLSNTRYNKALLMRIERSKQKVAGKPQSAPPTKPSMLLAGGGVMACPNTPELPRRNVKSATTRSSMASQRQSMPRDTSLSRLAQQVPNSLASAKKQLLQTAANVSSSTANAPRSTSSQRATPRYLDISKYKPAQSNQFLRKNDAKSTLKPQTNSNEIMKRSPSSSSMGLSRADPSRTSNRSVRSASSAMTSSVTSLGGSNARASSAVRRDASVSKQKEAEMAMWKRRSKYDPMKAAAEDRRKKEEAKRLAQAQQMGVVGMPTERQSRSLYRRGQL
ncbi:uncharacterized protein LOC133328010 isoform X2 [Musca vetustissima]|uniref:uncharacterized protein LOC133328010 isoform X2 n=1 Tax=Musca vetustissima TaxID=27455 RepID=UPI002AB7EFBF|nr:uncharacterized protein LOC133328010 isoform X2 [Musca vetustissima]